MTKNIVEKVEKAIGWNDWSVRMDRPFCERSEHHNGHSFSLDLFRNNKQPRAARERNL